MNSRLKFTTHAFCLSFFLLFFSLAHAQMPSSIDGVTIGTDPEIPVPGQTVTVNLESFSTDLNAASIVWLVDGKNYTQGVGKKSIGLTAPIVGKSTVVLAIMKTVEGKEVRKSITIKPGGVDLIWESDGYAPPLYPGKILFAYQNPVRIIAIPHLGGVKGELEPATLLYKWTENGQVIQDQSGLGKQTLTLQEALPKEMQIQVEVSTKTGSEKATAVMNLAPTDPSVSFYEEDPLYGVLYNKALTNTLRLTRQEINIRAVPYSFNSSKLNYLWSINNLERGDLSTNQSITLRTKGDTEGSSNVSLQVTGATSFLQVAENALSVLFSKKPADSATTF